MRVLFARMPGDTRHRYHGALPHVAALPRSAEASDRALKENYGLTMNKGNMFIGDAMPRLLAVDRRRSCFGTLEYMHLQFGRELGAVLRANFDLLVLSMANMIRPNQSHEAVVEALEQTDLPFVALGAGMQVAMPEQRDALSPSTRRLLEIFNERAVIFGVRGETTCGWLHAVGLDRAVPLGCPSLYVYPANVLATRAVADTAEAHYATAGYLEKPSRRAAALGAFFQGSRADYVFQEEIFHKSSSVVLPDGFYNDATGECDAATAGRLLAAIHGAAPPFARYWYFQDVEGWRQLYAHRTAYVGDRFHAGVGALQAGTAALIAHRDLRVRELAAFFGIPHVAVEELGSTPRAEVIGKHLSGEAMARFHARYAGRVLDFLALARRAGLKLAYDPAVLARVQSAAPAIASVA